MIDATDVTEEILQTDSNGDSGGETVFNVWRVPIYSYRVVNYGTEFKTIKDAKRLLSLLRRHKVVYITNIEYDYLTRFKNAIYCVWKHPDRSDDRAGM